MLFRSRRVRVHFTIGYYHDYVDCDVVPMQACSLLLGRPWQYDNNDIHHGRTNSYTLMFEGKSINLLPMTPAEIVNDEKFRAPRNVKVDGVHALLAFNYPIHDFAMTNNAASVSSDPNGPDCMHSIISVLSVIGAQMNYLHGLVSQELCDTYICKNDCLLGSALFSLFNNFQVDDSRGRLCF